MQIVIDIPEEDYKFIKDLQFYNSGRRSGRTIEQNVINGIKNGTVLPEGRGEDRYNQAIKDVTEHILKMRTHYADCTMCSISESIIGETVCDGVLRYLKEKGGIT